ncbi:MAG: tetratricopeptide repeat protein [Bacteroidetes Order II. Incertae sedis bacterium]|nr:tetratricopeptide repeat protein [Bacteroidetes Order II. bacterium]
MNHVALLYLVFAMCFAPILHAQTNTPNANQLFQAQKWAEAAEAYRGLSQEKPENFLNWYRLGYAQQMLQQFPEAIRAYEKGLSLNANAPLLKFQLSRIYAALSDQTKALNYLEAAISAGFSQAENIEQAPEFVAMKQNQVFQNLVRSAKKQQTPCMYQPEYRKFDFWVGKWDVKISGQLVGKNTIEIISNGCALLENWTATSGGAGKSINFYDPVLSKWKQTWVGGQGGPMEFVEVRSDENAMIFEANITNPTDKKTKITRLSFTKEVNGDVRQHFEDSFDGGKTWQSTFNALYVRV